MLEKTLTVNGIQLTMRVTYLWGQDGMATSVCLEGTWYTSHCDKVKPYASHIQSFKDEAWKTFQSFLVESARRDKPIISK